MSHEFTENSIRIRPYKPEDAQPLFEAAVESIPDVYLWLPWCHPGYSKDESQAWIAHCEQGWYSGKEFQFAVVPKDEDKKVLGGCGLNAIDFSHRTANLGYWVRSGASGNGIATTAALMVARFGMESLKLIRIEIVMSIHNKRSKRVAEKIGAQYEGILRHRLLIHEEPHDAYLYSLIPEDLGLKG